MIADTLSNNPYSILASLALKGWKRATTIEGNNLQYYEDENFTLVYNVIATANLFQRAKETQWHDGESREIWNKLQNGEQLDGPSTNHEGFVYYKGRLVISNNPNLLEALLIQAH